MSKVGAFPPEDSDTDGSEDVFLDLAQSDEEQEGSNNLTPMPGHFSDRPSYPAPTPRPHSSGILSRPATDQNISRLSQHSRHASQPAALPYLNPSSAARHSSSIASTRTVHVQPRADTAFDTSETPRLRRPGNIYLDAEEYADKTPWHTNRARKSMSVVAPSHCSVIDPHYPRDSDSAESITAASTVWDELDDLKSRIRKLESSGRLPLTSNAAMAGHTTVRPQTATTAPTTVSSSPKNVKKQSLADATSSTVGQDIHPTLQSALARAQTTLQPHIFRPLEATVVDALALAGLSGRPSPTAPSAATNGTALQDRQLRRKADNLCRNLADLCIAICDNRSEETAVSPIHNSSPRYYSPRASEARDRRSSVGWARLDDFRAARGLSISGQQASMPNLSPAQVSPTTGAKDYASRYSTVEPAAPIANEENRPPSRAMTDLNALPLRTSKIDHLRLAPVQRSPSLRETLEARRRSTHIRDDDGSSAVGSQSVVGRETRTPAARSFLDRIRGAGSETSSTPSAARYREPYTPRFATPAARAGSVVSSRYSQV